MMDWTDLASIFAAFFIVAASPGPATLAVSAVSAASGRRRGMVYGAGLGAGLAFWGIIAATGLGAVLQSSAHLLLALKIAGGVYLLWLALQSARSAVRTPARTAGIGAADHKSTAGFFAKGLILNLSNPKAVVAWMAALSVGLGGDESWVSVWSATLGCAIIGLLIYAGYAAAFSLSAVMAGYAKSRRWIDRMVSMLFAFAGFALLRSAFART